MPSKWTLLLATIAVIGASNCRKNQPQNPTTETTVPGVARPDPPVAAADSGTAMADTFVAPPAGPHAAVLGEHAELDARITGPSVVPGQGTLEVVLQSKDGYHVNELDEVQLMLEGTRSTIRAELARTDAAESDQNHVKFVIPAAIAAANATIHGRIRFSVCSEVCIRQRLAFDVALP